MEKVQNENTYNILVTALGIFPANEQVYAKVKKIDKAQDDMYIELESENKKDTDKNNKIGYVVDNNYERNRYGYPFLAILALADYQFDEIIIIGTKQSKLDGLRDYLNKKLSSGKQNEIVEQDEDVNKEDGNIKEKEKIKKEIQEKLGELYKQYFPNSQLSRDKINIIDTIIAERTETETTANIKELTKLFESRLVDPQLKEKTIQFSIDVSLGLRPIPMYANTILNYLSVKNQMQIDIKLIYGMYDAVLICKNNYCNVQQTIKQFKQYLKATKEFLKENQYEEIQKELSKIEKLLSTINKGNTLRDDLSSSIKKLKELLKLYIDDINMTRSDVKKEFSEFSESIERLYCHTVMMPLLNMDEMTEITKWTRAVNVFFTNGSIVNINELLKSRETYFEWVENDKNQIVSGRFHLIEALEQFYLAINSNNLPLFRQSVDKFFNCFTKTEERGIEVRHAGKAMPEYVRDILISVYIKLSQYFSKTEANEQKISYASDMLAIAKWHCDQDRLGDAVVALQEGMITYVIEHYDSHCRMLLRKKKMTLNQDEEYKFNYKARKIIRETVFEGEDVDWEGWEEWNKWLSEYHIIKQIRDSAMLLPYNNDSKKRNNNTEELDCKIENKNEQDLDIETIKGSIHELISKMLKDTIIEERIKYLSDVKKYYDVFISYRRSYQSEGENDGVLLVTAIADFLTQNDCNVFWDKESLEGECGRFTDLLASALLNSRYFVVILGKDCFKRPYNDDEFYKENLCALEKEKDIFVVVMDGFDEKHLKKNETIPSCEKDSLLKLSNQCQRVGGKVNDVWKYEQILTLREKILEEIQKKEKKDKK